MLHASLMPQIKGLITVFQIIEICCLALQEDITKNVINMSDMTLRTNSGKVGITEQTIITLVCSMLHASLMNQIKGLLILFQIIESLCPDITKNVINMSDMTLPADSGKVGITEQTIITLVCSMLHASPMNQIKGLLTLFQIIKIS